MSRDQTMDRMERFNGVLEIGFGITTSAAGVGIALVSALVEGVRRTNTNLYTKAMGFEVDPGVDPVTIAIGSGGLAMMGAGIFIAHHGVSILERVRDRRNS